MTRAKDNLSLVIAPALLYSWTESARRSSRLCVANPLYSGKPSNAFRKHDVAAIGCSGARAIGRQKGLDRCWCSNAQNVAVISPEVDRNEESPTDNRLVSPIQSLDTEKATVKTDSRFSPAESCQKQFSLRGESRVSIFLDQRPAICESGIEQMGESDASFLIAPPVIPYQETVYQDDDQSLSPHRVAGAM
jgi:hypothetical protein